MAKSLLIVESPAKARTIGKYLGSNFEVRASVGHIRDLPVNRLGVDVEEGFAPEYVTIQGKQKIINELKKAAQGKETIYLGPDPDREGEAIAWHIADILKGKDRDFRRVLFHELTPSAILSAIEHPETLSEQRFESQQARRILDRLVGYRLSPLLWDKVKRGLSAGRVQSVALRIITDREREIFAFKPEEYWSLAARLLAEGVEFSARLFKQDGKRIELKTGDQAGDVVRSLQEARFTVKEVVSKERKRHAAPAFTTSQLQQEAFGRLRLPARQTMRLAQQLYEGLELGSEGSVGLITYMRTDSVRVADTALSEVRQLIQARFGKEYLPARPLHYRNKKGSQDAHEAIRPTSAARTPEQVSRYLSGSLLALYELIWRRFVASQMNPAIFDQTTADIEAGPYLFRATGSVIRFKGFLEVYDRPSKDDREILPPLTQGQPLELLELLPRQHFTQPPPRFTEATLVKELEENGIGRPSTYAQIISTLRDKEYVASNKGQLSPTELGFIVSDLLVESFPRIMNVEFTAGMENELDEIEEGRVRWQDVLDKFFQPFEVDVVRAAETMQSLKRDGLKTDLTCDKCASNMVLKYGRNGPFLSCDRYPECRNAFDFTRDDQGRMVPVKQEPAATDETCDKCGKPMVMKNGRYGPFLACSGYPECKNTRPLNGALVPENLELPEGMDPVCDKCGGKMAVKRNRQGSLFIACDNYPKCKNTRPYPTGVKCPKKNCDGDLVERSSKRGVFYGCTNYPKCRTTLRTRPVNQACPVCGHPFLVESPQDKQTGEKESRGGLVCPGKDCDYRSSEPDRA
ncbi:MAG: type I DNA topoisomerase [Proteobacteria bacterium]|nr:type I DNA topoisomerase [Pseudomonadota bacterium]